MGRLNGRSATKGAVLQLARSVAAEHRGYSICCSVSRSGSVRTAHGLREIEELNRLGQNWDESGLIAKQPRICEPDEASFGNRSALYVDDGWHSKG